MHTVICVEDLGLNIGMRYTCITILVSQQENSLFKNLNCALNLGVLMASILMEDLKNSWSIWYNNCTCI